MWHVETDYAAANTFSGLALRRTYNSNPINWDASVLRTFGVRWTQQYEVSVKPEAIRNLQSPESYMKCWRRADTGMTTCEINPQVPVLVLPIPDAVSVLRGDGKRYFFNRSGLQWVTDANTNERISASYNADNSAVTGWTLVSAQTGTTEQFDVAGRLISITERGGSVQRLTYSDGSTNNTSIARVPFDAPVCTHTQNGDALPAGLLLCVTDSWGRQLQFEYDGKGRIVTTIEPGNQMSHYAYDGPSAGCLTPDESNPSCSADNLTKVTYPDGKSHIYYYNETARINDGAACAGIAKSTTGFGHLPHAMTGLIDENGDRHISWTYNCQGKATSSELGNGAEKVTVAYTGYSTDYAPTGGAPMTVTHYSGMPENPVKTASQWNYKKVLGAAKLTSVGSPCAECGIASSFSYDANGNVAQRKDWDASSWTTYTYDLSRNLETKRVEGSGTSSRTTTTEWHPTLRLPVKIAEPKRLSTYVYDAAGNLLTQTTQATTDASGSLGFGAVLAGSPRTVAYTYNTFGQRITMTGPRDDITDLTRYDYDPSSGNLISITNAAGHATTLSNYDADGRVGTIISPNGLKTDMTYTLRGWIKSQTTTDSIGSVSLVTTYEYDNAGQITSVQQPGQGTVTFQYDSAHRLTDVSDSMGNTIHYVLDIMGNRVQEQVKDPNGSLTLQVTRTFDTLKRLTSVTGAAQ